MILDDCSTWTEYLSNEENQVDSAENDEKKLSHLPYSIAG